MKSPFELLQKKETMPHFSKKNLFSKKLIHLSLKKLLPYIKSKNPKKTGAIIHYAAPSFGSLGDQAMFISATKGLKNSGFHETSLLSAAQPSKTDLPEFANNLLNPDNYFNGSMIEIAKFQKKIASNDGFFIIGADVMDGYYSISISLHKIHLLELADSLGLPAKVFGFSFNENPAEEVVNALRNLPSKIELLARDPVSQRRLESKLNRPICLVADLAFLLEPDPLGNSAKNTLKWIKDKKKLGAKIIGINANALLARDNFQDPFPIAAGLAKTIIEVNKIQPELHFLMIAHDFRAPYNDVMMNRLITELISFSNIDLSNKIYTMPTPCSAAEVKAVCAELEFAITGRMHLAIACLGQGTPALCIGYQGKMEGLFEHFELDDMVITPKDAFTSNKLLEAATHLLEVSSIQREQINRILPKVLSLAKKNFE